MLRNAAALSERRKRWVFALGLLYLMVVASLFLLPEDHVEFTVDISSRVASTAQVFYDTGFGYREIDSSSVPVPATSEGTFATLTFNLPYRVKWLRFDPLTTAGIFVVRNVEVHAYSGVLRILPQQIRALHEINSRTEAGHDVVFTTAADAHDPSLLIDSDVGKGLRLLRRRCSFHLLLVWTPLIFLCGLIVVLLPRQMFENAGLSRCNAMVAALAQRASAPGFIQFDGPAIWFYFACSALFLIGSAADVNGSSAGVFRSVYGQGLSQKATEKGAWMGAPRRVRSDEWAYLTPNILNQTLRAERFEARDTELGSHFAGLTGNIPVRHFSTLFRPQLWPFFLLSADYAYSVNWQFKGFILLTGVFTWLLLITKSTLWAGVGSLWFFFSPFTQWSYSWPSALPEMIGSVCFTMVLGCFMTIGRNVVALMLAAAGFALCCINFTMCAYVPQLVPLAWLAVFFLAGWCIAQRRLIFAAFGAKQRVAAVFGAMTVIAATGLVVYSDLHGAIAALGNTVYPGKRIFSGGSYPAYALVSHFFEWNEQEYRYPPMLANICEASGFLWLAPVTLLCFTKIHMTREQKCYGAALWGTFCFLLAWLTLPLPAWFGAIFGLQETAGTRVFPALGLANVAIVVLCIAALRRKKVSFVSEWGHFLLVAIFAVAAMLFLLHADNQKLGSYFSKPEVMFASTAAGLLMALLICGRKSAFAFFVLLPQVLLFGRVNPLERGLPVFLASDLAGFVRAHPVVKQGKWMVFSDSVPSSGFLAATGCEVYTGTRYLPDIDHFPLFTANHYDLGTLNRGGYLIAHLRKEGEPARMQLTNPMVMQWDVRPSDPIVKQLGIHYVASDQPLMADAKTDLIPLTTKPVDGFWLYRLD